MDLLTAAKKYRNAKIRLTKCQQAHFRQVCHRCAKYARCEVYSTYADAWMDLQDAVNAEEERL